MVIRAPLRSAALLLVGCMLLTGCSLDDKAAEADAALAVEAGAPGALPALPDSVLTPPDSATAQAFADAMAFARQNDLHTQPLGAIMQALGERYAGRPYLAGTLDEPPTERLVVRFDGFDCVTFIETTLAMARTIKAQTYRYAAFARHMVDQRYRNGGPVGYCARLHYFTDWIGTNAQRGALRRLGPDLGGRVLSDTLNFMSTHRSAYDRFATNDSLYACIQDMEATVQAAQQQRPVRYVPQDSIRATYDQLRAGDLVAFVTSIDGLDVAHTGLVYKHDDGRTGLLHASTSGGVVVLPDLQRYVQQIDHQIGIVVARAVRKD